MSELQTKKLEFEEEDAVLSGLVVPSTTMTEFYSGRKRRLARELNDHTALLESTDPAIAPLVSNSVRNSLSHGAATLEAAISYAESTDPTLSDTATKSTNAQMPTAHRDVQDNPPL